jgi:hypothetical protein
MRIVKSESGYRMWLSANDTYAWAHKPGTSWPGSDLSGRRAVVTVDSNGLCDLSIDGRNTGNDVSGDELSACVADHLPADCRQFWPTWSK